MGSTPVKGHSEFSEYARINVLISLTALIQISLAENLAPISFAIIGQMTWGPFLESPETLRAIFGCHNSLFISRTKRFYVVKLHSQFAFCYLENMLKDRPSKISGWQFHNWLFGDFEKQGPRARFSKVPKLYGPFSGATIPFLSQERRGF